MANRISDRMVKAFERFNADLKAFGEETGETFVTLYEDAFTTRGGWQISDSTRMETSSGLRLRPGS